MKKLFLLFFLSLFIGFASAQFSAGVKVTQTTSDTIKTGALTVNKYITLTGGYSTVSIQPIVTKVSGTIAGKVYIGGTIDGTNYVAIDSLTLSDVSVNTKIHNETPNRYAKYKIWGVGTGTMKGLLTIWYIARRTATE